MTDIAFVSLRVYLFGWAGYPVLPKRLDVALSLPDCRRLLHQQHAFECVEWNALLLDTSGRRSVFNIGIVIVTATETRQLQRHFVVIPALVSSLLARYSSRGC